MPMQVAMLRADQLALLNDLAPGGLFSLLAELGLADIRSLLRGSNLVFRSEMLAGPELECRLEREIHERLAVTTDLFCRTAEEWRAIVARNPFRTAAAQDSGHLMVMFLKEAPPEPRWQALRQAIIGPERSSLDGRQLYVHYPNGMAGSHLTRTLLAHQLGGPVAGRSWHTILQVRRLMQSMTSSGPRGDPSPTVPPGWTA